MLVKCFIDKVYSLITIFRTDTIPRKTIFFLIKSFYLFLKFRSISFLDYFIHTTNLMSVARQIIFFYPILPFIICRYHYFYSYQKVEKKETTHRHIKNAEHLFYGKHFLRSSAALQTIRMYVHFPYTYIHISVSCSKKSCDEVIDIWGGESFLVIVLIQEQIFFFFIMTFR